MSKEQSSDNAFVSSIVVSEILHKSTLFCVNCTTEMEVCFYALCRVNVGDQNIRVSMNIPPGYLGYENFGMGKGVSTAVRLFIRKNLSLKPLYWTVPHVFTILFTKRPASPHRRTVFEERSWQRQNVFLGFINSAGNVFLATSTSLAAV